MGAGAARAWAAWLPWSRFKGLCWHARWPEGKGVGHAAAAAEDEEKDRDWGRRVFRTLS